MKDFWFCKFELKCDNTLIAEGKKTHDWLLLLFEGVSGVFAHGQLHILNVIFRLTAVCEIATSNKKDKLCSEYKVCIRYQNVKLSVHGGLRR